jgi:hypothetical protein
MTHVIHRSRFVAATWTASTEASTPPAASAASDWLPLCQRQLDTVALLRANWDNAGAKPVDRETIAGARRLLLSLAGANQVSQPRVNPSRRGGVQFEWEKGPLRLEIEVTSATTAEFRSCDDDIGVETGSIREGQSLDPILTHIRRVATGN